MKPTRWLLLAVVLTVALALGWIIWAKPRRADMSAYAPADSLLYMESNDPLAIVHAVVATHAWKLIEKGNSSGWGVQPNAWLRQFFAITGWGPVQSVVVSRAQLAVVVTDLGTKEEGDTLRVKPEVALIIETHTSEGRIRPLAEQVLKQLAESTYGNPTLRRTTINDVELVEWRSRDGSRQIIGSVVNSLIVVGNTEAVVLKVLETAAHNSPSLKSDINLQGLRQELTGEETISFGYVPQEKSARLLSFAVPVILGRTPGDVGFQKVVTSAGAKLLGSIAWSSRSYHSGIEDRYFITLQPSLLKQLQPALGPTISSVADRPLPENVYSLTYYRFEDPIAAWEGLRTSVAANVDAMSAIVFSSLLKSALVAYGISDPETFLRLIKGEILTLRLDADGDRAIVIARVNDQSGLRELFSKSMKNEPAALGTAGEFFIDHTREIAACLVNDAVVLGATSDVHQYCEQLSRNTRNNAQLSRMTFYSPINDSSGPILTFTDDSDSVRRFFAAIRSTQKSPAAEPSSFEQQLSQLPYAATETKFSDQRLERVTRSPLGQFSSLLPLLIPDQSPQSPGSPAR